VSQQYFEPDPTSDSTRRKVRVRLPSGEIELLTSGGVFSPNRLDAGTKVLLDALGDLSALPEQPIVDLGCGYGPVVAHLATAYPDRRFWAVDVNTRSLELCQVNMEMLGVGDRVRIVGPGEVPAGPVAGIVSNPPIRIGKEALHDLLECWLRAVTPGGESWLVVQKNLGADSLTRWLNDSGHPTEKVASKKGYRVLRVESHGVDAEP
jgi:16S rRNA G1207 methylase RsmC